ncbi:fumarylacetoacetate hydrolase family protein [Advenella kashmirensis]
MRWLRYSLDGKTGYGILSDEDIITAVRGDPLEHYETTATRLQLQDVTIEVPIVPPTFYCVGLNYVKHISTEGLTIPKKPDVGYRANNALVAHGQDVIMPADATRIHYEGELVVVIGKKAKNISAGEVKDCIFGYTIGNDVSERNWQASDRTFWRAKNTDTFKPMGPWICTDAEVASMQTVVSVNGEQSTRFDTADMLFGVEEFISTMSRYLTLYPGDMVWMGTDGHSPNLQPGDRVDVSLTGLGTLSNRFVKEALT